MNSKLFTQAMKIAQTYDVATPKNGAVLYSISFQPTKENKIKAYDFVKGSKGKKICIDHTECGSKLIEIGIDSGDSGLTKDERTDIWAAASKRFIKSASGNITAFVDNADDRSIFKRIELPNIIENPNIKTINQVDKYRF